MNLIFSISNSKSLTPNKPHYTEVRHHNKCLKLVAEKFVLRAAHCTAQRCILPVSFRWICYWHSNKSGTRKQTGKMHLCALSDFFTAE